MMKVWICRFSVGLNVFIFAVALGAWINRDVFIDMFLTQLYKVRVSFFDSFPLQPDNVVMLGDSITAGGEWNELFPGVQIRNRGIPGDTTTGVLARLDSIVDRNPAAVFLKIGTNDLTRIPQISTSLQQYREIISAIQTGSPSTDIYVQSLLPRAQDMRVAVEAYNLEIQAMATALGVTYIDLYPDFLAPDGSIKDELTYDELHLTGAGYELWQSLLSPTMSRYEVRCQSGACIDSK
jgi:lysophospholipase L1-like esterase